MTKSALDRLDALIDDVDDFRERVLGVTNDDSHISVTDNSSFSTSNSSLSDPSNLDSPLPLLKLSTDIDDLLSRDLLESNGSFNTLDHGWVKLIKSFPLQRNVKQGIVTQSEFGFNQPLPTVTPSNAPNCNLVYRTDLKTWTTIPEDSFNFTTLPKPFVTRHHSFKFGRKKKTEPKRKPNSVRLRPKPKIEMVSDSLVIKSFNDSTKKKLTISSSATTTSYEGSSSIGELTNSADSSPLVGTRNDSSKSDPDSKSDDSNSLDETLMLQPRRWNLDVRRSWFK